MIFKIIRIIFRFIFTNLVRNNSKEYGLGLKVNFYSKVNSSTILGKNVNMNGLKISGNGNVIIGDNFHSGKNCLINTQNHNYNGKTIPYDNTYILKNVVIEDNVWIGNNVIILGDCRIGEGAIIQAGAVVVKDIPPLSIVGGNPAKTFSNRNKEHYFSLKKQKLFH